MRRVLLAVLYFFSVFVVATALLAIIGGPTAEPGGGPVPPTIDNEFRFAHVIWLAVGVLLFWSARRPAERALVTRVLLVVAMFGGLARLLSVAVVGWPHPVFIAANVLELIVLPLVIWWHSRVFPVASRPSPAAG